MSTTTDLNLELVVGGTAPVITSNFSALKEAIATRLEAYKIQVTEENLAQAKKDATELGKAALQLNKLKTEKAKDFSAPVEAFKAQVMELVGMIQEGQEFIKKQVAVFEDKTKAVCLEKMTACLRGAYLSGGVREEFQVSFPKLSDMVGISKIGTNGELKKAARDAVAALATTDRGLQDRTDGRISKLTADCYAAGLKTPLSRAHIESLLLSDDATYQAGLANLINIEVDRQEASRRLLQEEEERKARAKVAEENRLAKEKAEREAKAAKEKTDREAQEKAEAERKASAPPPPPPPPKETPLAPNPPTEQPLFAGPMAPTKAKLQITLQFSIETTKFAPQDVAKIESWFRTSISAIPGMPSFQFSIRKEF